MATTRIDLAGLTTRIVEPDAGPDAGPDTPKLTCVLMHGFGASGDDLVPLADAIDAPVRFVFPAAPLELGGLYGDARAWWMIDIAQIERDLARGTPSDRRAEVPEGLADARDQVLELIDQLDVAPDQLVLGGFSQGAMLALDVALHLDQPPAGLLLMSGTIINQAAWSPRMATLTGVPVMQSHGRGDGLLPFGVAELLRDQLVAAGAVVDWQPFAGGHEIPMTAIAAITQLLRSKQ